MHEDFAIIPYMAFNTFEITLVIEDVPLYTTRFFIDLDGPIDFATREIARVILLSCYLVVRIIVEVEVQRWK